MKIFKPEETTSKTVTSKLFIKITNRKKNLKLTVSPL